MVKNTAANLPEMLDNVHDDVYIMCMTNTTTDVTDKLIAYRKAEAERIARIDGYAILWHDEDWRTFGIDDPVQDKGVTWRTFYSFEGGRFEGAVSSWTPEE